MVKKLVSGLFVGLVSLSSYADFSGAYQCDTIHKGQPVKGVTTVTQKDNNLTMMMQWEGKNKVITTELMSTNDLNIFISSWKGNNSVGIGLWQFKDQGVTINTTSLRKDNLSKIEEIINCVKSN